MQARPSRLKRIVLTSVALELLVAPLLFVMESGPPKVIVFGIWTVILVLTAAALFVIGIATSKR